MYKYSDNLFQLSIIKLRHRHGLKLFTKTGSKRFPTLPEFRLTNDSTMRLSPFSLNTLYTILPVFTNTY